MADHDDVKATLHKALLDVEELLLKRPDELDDEGICLNAYDWMNGEADRDPYFDIDILDGALGKLMVQWPEYSGNPEYPVPHPRCDVEFAYATCELWNLETKYGQARYRLLKWLIKETEQ